MAEQMSTSPSNDFPSLQTDRLVLRELTKADSEALFVIHSDQEWMKYFGVDPPAKIEQVAQMIEVFASWRKLPSPGTRWGIQRKDNGRLIGSCGLFGYHPLWRKCTIGFELHRTAVRKGYMSEALTCIIDWAFESSDLNRIEAQVHPENTPSLRTLERLGFLPEGLQRQAGYWNETHHDLIMLALLRSDERSGA